MACALTNRSATASTGTWCHKAPSTQWPLHPGSNPVYGLNTLGGAIAVRTKTGFSAPGHQFEAYGGSWDRHSEELTSGWNNGEFGYFIDLHHFDEKGWRAFSPSKADQVFGTLSWRGDKGSLDLTLAATDNQPDAATVQCTVTIASASTARLCSRIPISDTSTACSSRNWRVVMLCT